MGNILNNNNDDDKLLEQFNHPKQYLIHQIEMLQTEYKDAWAFPTRYGHVSKLESIAKDLKRCIELTMPPPEKSLILQQYLHDRQEAQLPLLNIQYISDIHLEFTIKDFPKTEFDLLKKEWQAKLNEKFPAAIAPTCSEILHLSLDLPIPDWLTAYFHQIVVPGVSPNLALLGDIGLPSNLLHGLIYAFFLRWTRQHWRRVFLLTGNHEYYCSEPCQSISQMNADIRSFCQTLNDLPPQDVENSHQIYFFNRDALLVDGVWILGATLWYGPLVESDHPLASSLDLTLEYRINDFRNIFIDDPVQGNVRKLLAHDIYRLHQHDLQWIQEQILQIQSTHPSSPVIVLSHHAPVWAATDLVDDHQETPYLIFADGTLLDPLFQDPLVAWLFGHTHLAKTLKVKSTLISTNPRGYVPQISPDYSSHFNLSLNDPLFL